MGSNYFKRNDCNTICDITGLKVKLSETRRRWDGVIAIDDQVEPRHPQDFPVKPRPQHVFRDSRFYPPDTAYTPPNEYEDL